MSIFVWRGAMRRMGEEVRREEPLPLPPGYHDDLWWARLGSTSASPQTTHPDPEMERRFHELLNTASFRGAIGNFPDGKLTKSDEGALQFGVSEKDGRVVLDFGTPVAWVGMTPQQAADLGSLMLKKAREAARKTGDMVSFTIG